MIQISSWRSFAPTTFPSLPQHPMLLNFTQLKKYWYNAVKAVCPDRSKKFPYNTDQHAGVPPPFVPEGNHWLDFGHKKLSPIGSDWFEPHENNFRNQNWMAKVESLPMTSSYSMAAALWMQWKNMRTQIGNLTMLKGYYPQSLLLVRQTIRLVRGVQRKWHMPIHIFFNACLIPPFLILSLLLMHFTWIYCW